MFNIGLTGFTAICAIKFGFSDRMVNSGPLMYPLLLCLSMIMTMICTILLDVNEDYFAKHIYLIIFDILAGLSLCTSKPLNKTTVKVSLYTIGIFIALSYIAINSQKGKYLWMGYPLIVLLSMLLLSSLTGLFLPLTMTRTLKMLQMLSICGGLYVFCFYVLYDTQKIMQEGEKYKEYLENIPIGSTVKYPDYINASLDIYLDILNIFSKLLDVLNDIEK